MSDSSSIPDRPGTSSRVFAMIIAGAVLLSAGSALLLTGPSGDSFLRWLKGQQKGGSAFDLWHGQPAPELLVVPWQGHPLQLSELRGRPVVLAFWASWSPLSHSLLRTLNEWAAARPDVAVLWHCCGGAGRRARLRQSAGLDLSPGLHCHLPSAAL
jgi:thiol-disulfide isomerase/thioredoxin